MRSILFPKFDFNRELQLKSDKMLNCFSALNESSNGGSEASSSDESSRKEENFDFQDDDYIALYNTALASYGKENFGRAEGEFRHLAESPYFKHCGKNSQRPRNVAIKLEFNALRYLGMSLAKREAYDEALAYIEKALEIDGSDPTVYFRYATIAVRANKLVDARRALEISMGNDVRQGYKTVRHWPTLELVISLTYKLDDCLMCLDYIAWALKENPSHEKSLRIRQKIYDEYPFLHPDPAQQKKEPIYRPLVVRVVKEEEPPTSQVVFSKPTLQDLIASVVKEYGPEGRMKDLLLPMSVSFQKEDVMADKAKNEEILNDVKMVLGDIVDRVASQIAASDAQVSSSEDTEMEVDEEADVSPAVNTEATEIVQSVLDNLVNEAETLGFMRSILFEAADAAVTESIASNTVSSRRSRPAATFLNEVPIDLIEKRRSSRMRGGGGGGGGGLGSNPDSLMEPPKGDDVTAKSLLESFFPESLLDETATPLPSPRKTPVKKKPAPPTKADPPEAAKSVPNTGTEGDNKDGVGNAEGGKWLTVEEEEQLTMALVNENLTKSCLNQALTDLLMAVMNRVGDGSYSWSKEFDQAFLRLYQCWRPHQVLPEELVPQEPHEYLPAILVGNEILLRDLIDANGYSAEECEDEDPDDLDGTPEEFLWEDLQHLALNIFRVPRTDAVRILSLHLHYYRYKGKVRRLTLNLELQN